MLILLAMSIGVAAVVLVSSLGEGARRYVLAQFGSLGTHLLIVLPGRSETGGVTPGIVMAKTPRPLTLDDALALRRSTAVQRVAPLVVGAGEVRWQAMRREATLLGTTAELREVRHLKLAQGQFLPAGDARHASPVCVLGAKLRDELFGPRSGSGEWLRIGDRRLRVIGVLAPHGESLGTNFDEVLILPVSTAMALFDTESLFRILIEARSREAIVPAREDALDILRQRHEGERDVTVITQDAVLATFDRILGAPTAVVGGIAAISLGVAGILIMNVMLISVTQRHAEIGLLKAIGATSAQIRLIFFTEAILLAAVGSLLGLAVGQLASALVGRLLPAIPFAPPWWALIAAPLVAVLSAVVFSILPARRAARLSPVQALARR